MEDYKKETEQKYNEKIDEINNLRRPRSGDAGLVHVLGRGDPADRAAALAGFVFIVRRTREREGVANRGCEVRKSLAAPTDRMKSCPAGMRFWRDRMSENVKTAVFVGLACSGWPGGLRHPPRSRQEAEGRIDARRLVPRVDEPAGRHAAGNRRSSTRPATSARSPSRWPRSWAATARPVGHSLAQQVSGRRQGPPGRGRQLADRSDDRRPGPRLQCGLAAHGPGEPAQGPQ